MSNAFSDKSGTRQDDDLKQSIPGSIFQHTQTLGWYWQVARRFVPKKNPHAKKKSRYVLILLVPVGQTVATKNRRVAAQVQKLYWAQWQMEQVDSKAALTRSMDKWLDAYRE